MSRIIVAGATGFVGQHLLAELPDGIGTSRNPEGARRRFPKHEWAALDLHDPDSLTDLLEPGDCVVYLIHEMGDGDGYEERDGQGAENFAAAAAAVGIDRVVYLGGPTPKDHISEHLKSRQLTADTIRSAGIPTFELQAGMIMGKGSESWCIARDLSVRLPVMLVPKWLLHKSEPIGIQDIVSAIKFCLETDATNAGTWGVPGPERLSFADILQRVALLQGFRPVMIPVPFLTPSLSAHWLRLVTRANMTIAHELVQGLGTDLVCDGPDLWSLMDGYERMSFDDAATRALRAESRQLPPKTLAVERLIRTLSRKRKR